MPLSVRILIGLVVGLSAGALYTALGGSRTGLWIDGAATLGGVWLNALRMTIIPLVFSLLVVGLVKARSRVGRRGLASQTVLIYLALLVVSAFLGVAYISVVLGLFPAPESARAAINESLNGGADAIMLPPLKELLINVIPTNPVAAAAEGAILPVVIFAVFLAFAMSRLVEPQKNVLFNFFDATAEAMIVIVRWVLVAAPLGVAGLAFVVGARSGLDMAVGYAHYVLVMIGGGFTVVLVGYAVAFTAGKQNPMEFIRRTSAAQAVALGTQSSVASLPAMLRVATRLGLRRGVSRVTLPIAVSIFRFAGPWTSMAVALYAAHVYGVEIEPLSVIAACFVAVGMEFSSSGLPNQVNFFTVYTPVFAVLGVPIEILALFIAVETAPDAANTAGNVTMNLGVTAALNERFHDQAEGHAPSP